MKLAARQCAISDFMGCKICENLPPAAIKKLNKHVKAGKHSVAKIARHFKVLPEDVTAHLSCLENANDETQELLRSQEALASLIQKLRAEIDDESGDSYDALDEGGNDRGEMIRNYLAAMRESREITMALSRLRSGEEMYRDLRETVVDPLVRGLTKVLVDEGKRLRDELFDIAKHDQTQHPRIKQAIDEMLIRAADQFSSETLRDLYEKVQNVVSKRKNPSKAAPTTH
jgi:DNA-binding MarR family transcriptional regulator